MPERHDIVLLYAPAWDGPTRFSKHHLARYLAERGNRVLYVEAPLTPLGLRRGRGFWRELATTFRAPAPVATIDRLWRRRFFQPVPYHAVTPLTNTRAANTIGQRLAAPVIRRDLQRLGFQRPVVIAGLPHAVDALAGVPHCCLVYHCADDYSHVKGFPSSLPELEADLCRRANLVITTSSTLCEDRRQFNPSTYWVPNGAEVEHFSQPAEPAAELRDLPRPLIGFVGGLSQWVDVDLIAYLATKRQQWTFVLIGPTAIDVSAIRGLPNVRLLGPRPYADVPSYLAGMDVGVIPFRSEPVVFHADPIKAYEYLAAGLPVVATDMPALHRLQPLVRLADSPVAFLEQLDAAVAEGRTTGEQARRAEAAKHSWGARFAEVERLIAQACGC